MPELPEVETMRRGVAHLAGRVIDDLEIIRNHLKPIGLAPRPSTFRRRIQGRTLVDFQRRGKRVLALLDDGQAIVFEPRMTGLVLVAEPPDEQHLRVVVHLRPAAIGTADRLAFWDRRGLGSVRLLDAPSVATQLGPQHLGPDALEVSAEVLRDRLGKSRRAIKVALLDQRALAGIGNLYASEILHVAQVHPDQRCHRLRRADWESIAEAMHMVLQEAILYEGSTLGDGTYRNALNQNGSYQNHHRVYNRHGERCATCQQGIIERIVQAQRSTFFCARCQRKSRRR